MRPHARERRRMMRLRKRLQRLMRRSDRENLEAQALGLQLAAPPHLSVAEVQELRFRRLLLALRFRR